MSIPCATLKPGREPTAQTGHPWVFSGAIARWSAPPRPGAVVEVAAADGTWIARGLADPEAALAVRLYTHTPGQTLDAAFFTRQLAAALDRRDRLVLPHEPDTDSFRLCFSEADALSGLIIDRYADTFRLDCSIPHLLGPFLPALTDLLAARGLRPAEPGTPVAIRESGLTYQVDAAGGQKTGFYLDQRVNRRRVAAYAANRRCLGAYCYTGGFELHLARAGAASVTGVDSSAPALARAREHAAGNGFADRITWTEADVPSYLRTCRDRRDTFDLIVLDPPKFVASRQQKDKGLRAYKDINLLAMKLLTPGGILATFSCSGWISREDLLTALRWAAADARRTVRILETLTQPPDHPVLLPFPESDYLGGFLLAVE